MPLPGFGARGGDIDSKGVVWVSMGSGHIGSFDRRKCKGPLNGPKATGDHCPEGWSFHKYPGPGFQGIGDNSAESSYYSWVDQHNTFGLGNDVPMSTGNLNDGLIAYANGRMVVLRVPYPIGFYAKGFDGRIDDPKAGWKGRGHLGGQRRSHAVADRRRQGQQAARRAFPAAAGSAGEVTNASRRCCRMRARMPDRRSSASETPISLSGCVVASAAMAVAMLQVPVVAQTCERLVDVVRLNASSPGTLARQLEQGPDVNCRLASGETPLLLAARAGDPAGVEMLLARGADPNSGRNARRSTVARRIVNVETPLILAADRGNEAMVRALLKAGARASLIWTWEGQSPSQLARQRGHQETFKILKAAEEAESGLIASGYVDEDIALRRIQYLARNPRDVSTGRALSNTLLGRIAQDAASMDKNWSPTFTARDQSFALTLTQLARGLEWALYTGDSNLLRVVAEDLATKRRDCDASREGRFGTCQDFGTHAGQRLRASGPPGALSRTHLFRSAREEA